MDNNIIQSNKVLLLYKRGDPDICEWLDAIASTILKQGFLDWPYKWRLDDAKPCMFCGSQEIYRYSNKDGGNTVDRCEGCGRVLDSDFTPPPEVKDAINRLEDEEDI